MPGHGTASFLSDISPCQLALSVGALALAGYIIGPSISGNSSKDSNSIGMLGSRREVLYITGLVNRANDCFANSILQALAGSSILHSFLAKYAQFGKLTSALLQTTTELNQLSHSQRCLSPWPFLHVIEQIYHSRISASQHDAHELLHVILETVANEYDSHLKNIGLKSTENPRPPFEGTTLDKLVCQRCGHSPKVTTSSYVVLSLVVPQQWHATLDKCLANFFTTELIQDYGCANCRLHALQGSPQMSPEMEEKLKVCDPDNLSPEIESMLPKSITSTLAKKTSLGLLPELFIIHLSRSIFSGSASRNSCRISFKERLALINDASQLTNYRLVAIVRHQGTHYSGHYESYRLKNWPKDSPITSPSDNGRTSKSSADFVSQAEIDTAHEESIRNGKTWWRINDDKVSSCKLDDVLNQTKAVYLLFYEKIHDQDGTERNGI